MRIAVENSTWNNIGDAFYQSSIANIFAQNFSDVELCVFDGPIKRAFRPGIFGENVYDSRILVKADLYVFSGPILGAEFIELYGPIIDNISRRGAHYCLISVHADPNPKVVAQNREFLLQYPPAGFSSRDDATYFAFQGISAVSDNGICAAFFAGDLVPSLWQENSEPDNRYLVSSFYAEREPKMFLSDGRGKCELANIEIVRYPSRFWRIERHFQFLQAAESQLKGVKIVRSHHDISYKWPHLNFGARNSYLSYNPRCYLQLYAGAELVITDRIHACVASISVGTPVMYVGNVIRDGLFFSNNVTSRRGFELIPDLKAIESKRADLVHVLGQIIQSCGVN